MIYADNENGSVLDLSDLKLVAEKLVSVHNNYGHPHKKLVYASKALDDPNDNIEKTVSNTWASIGTSEITRFHQYFTLTFLSDESSRDYTSFT